MSFVNLRSHNLSFPRHAGAEDYRFMDRASVEAKLSDAGDQALIASGWIPQDRLCIWGFPCLTAGVGIKPATKRCREFPCLGYRPRRYTKMCQAGWASDSGDCRHLASNRPQKACQLACNRRNRDCRFLSLGGQSAIALCEAHLGFPGDFADDARRLFELRLLSRADPRRKTVRPRALDEHAACSRIARLG